MPEAARLMETLTDDLAEIGHLAEKVADFLSGEGALVTDIAYVNLAIEELVTNTVRHGLGGSGKGNTIEVAISVTKGIVVTTIEDDGPEFNPFGRARVDTSLSLADRAIGGLGIHLVCEFMDRVAYRRVGGRNRVTLHRAIQRHDDAKTAGGI